MPFDVRCPDCKAKLRLDETPAKGVPIECPRCGSTFTPSEAAEPAGGGKAKKKKKDKAGPAGATAGDEKESKEREFMNPFLLLAIIGGVLVSYVLVCAVVLYLLGRSGRVEDMVGFIPKDCNLVRGINLTIMEQYPGYQGEADRYQTPAVKAALTELERVSEYEEPGAFQDYMLYGRQNGGNLLVFVFRSKENVDGARIKAGLGATDLAPPGGDLAGVVRENGLLQVPAGAPGLLAGAYLYLPTKRHVVLIPPGPGQGAALQATLRAALDRSSSFVPELGDTGRVAMRGHAWVVAKRKGPHEKQLDDIVNLMALADQSMKPDAKAIADKLKSTTTVALWNSFGAKARFGGGVECESSSAAAAVVKAVKAGDMGKGDEVEVPRWLKTPYPAANGKEFKQFQSKVDYRTSGVCAYYISSMTGEQSKLVLQLTDMPNMFDGGPGGRK